MAEECVCDPQRANTGVVLTQAFSSSRHDKILGWHGHYQGANTTTFPSALALSPAATRQRGSAVYLTAWWKEFTTEGGGWWGPTGHLDPSLLRGPIAPRPPDIATWPVQPPLSYYHNFPERHCRASMSREASVFYRMFCVLLPLSHS